ncbi:hypothetical protein PRNP1_011679 [Phytophthora ramorum]
MMPRTVPVAPKPKLFDEYDMPTGAAHKARIRMLQIFVKEQPSKHSANVGQKRRFRAAFDDFAWERNIKKVYENSAGHHLNQFEIDPMPLNEHSLELLLATVDDLIETSSMETIDTASETDKMMLVDAVMRAVCRECTSCVKIERNVTFKSEVLEPFGRVDLLRAGKMEKAIVMQCKKQDFDRGLTEMAIAVEIALLERMEKGPDSKANIYGFMSDFVTWHVMELSAKRARFCKFTVDASKREDDLRTLVGALSALVQGKEARDA